MASQENARKRLLEIAVFVRNQLDEEDISYPSREEVLENIKKGFKARGDEKPTVVRQLTEIEMELIIIDYQLFAVINRINESLLEKGLRTILTLKTDFISVCWQMFNAY